MGRTHRGWWTVVLAVGLALGSSCGGGTATGTTASAEDTSTSVSSSASEPKSAASEPSEPSEPSGSPAPQRSIDKTVWTPNGLEVTVTDVELDRAASTLEVSARFVNHSRVEESAGTVDLGLISGDDEVRAPSPTKKYPPGGTPVNDSYTISELPEGFSLDDASLYFGAPDERRSTIDLSTDGRVDTVGPRDIPVAGTLSMAYGGTYTVTAGQIVPFACNAGWDSEQLQFVPAKRDEFSVLLTGDFRSTDAPAGGYTYTSTAGGHTQLVVPDGTILAATSTNTHVFGPNQEMRDSPMCFSGVLEPATGDFELQMRSGIEPTGTLRFSVPPAA